MRVPTLAGSVAGHVVVVTALFFLHPPQRNIELPDAIQVNLMSASPAVAAPAPPKPEVKKREESKSTVKPDRTPNRPLDNPVKIPEGKEEEPKKVETPPEETTRAEPTGTPGLSAGVAVDAVNFEFTYYLIALRNKIGKNWSAPAGVSRGKEPPRVVVFFRIGRDGRVTDSKLEETSGIPFFDQSALRAVLISDPLPPLPMGFDEDELGVHFAFEFTGY